MRHEIAQRKVELLLISLFRKLINIFNSVFMKVILLLADVLLDPSWDANCASLLRLSNGLSYSWRDKYKYKSCPECNRNRSPIRAFIKRLKFSIRATFVQFGNQRLRIDLKCELSIVIAEVDFSLRFAEINKSL
jgi:hypothetical protein